MTSDKDKEKETQKAYLDTKTGKDSMKKATIRKREGFKSVTTCAEKEKMTLNTGTNNNFH